MSVEMGAMPQQDISRAAENLADIWLGEGQTKVIGRVGNWQVDAYRATIIDPNLIHPEIIKALPRAFSVGKYMPYGWKQLAYITFDLEGQTKVDVETRYKDRVQKLFDSLIDAIDSKRDPKLKWQAPTNSI